MFSRTTANRPILTAWVVFVLASTVVIVATLLLPSYWGEGRYDQGFLRNILVEAHGMLFDILVIGIFILWLTKKGEKHLENTRYRDEIDDFRNWPSEEASHRLAGDIRRLNRNGVTDIQLDRCFLSEARLTRADLTGAHLGYANLTGADLTGADLTHANLDYANLTRARLNRANLTDARLIFANLTRADLTGVDLTGADLTHADLTGAVLTNANLTNANLGYASLNRANLAGADLTRANLTRANLSDANLSEARLTLEQLCATRTLRGVTGLAPELMQQLKEQCPHLLEEPKDEG